MNRTVAEQSPTIARPAPPHDWVRDPKVDEAYRKMRLFPLYLCPFEQYLWHDDRPEFPMTFVIEMNFTGQLQVEPFNRALAGALDRHRIFQCTIQRAKKGKLCFVYDPKLFPSVAWGNPGDPIECPFPNGGFDATREGGLRIWVHQGKSAVKISFQFNHIYVDGIGSHFFLGDLFALYANDVEGPGTARLVEVDPTLFKYRAHRQRFASQVSDHPRSDWGAIQYAIKHALFSCQPLASPRPKTRQLQRQIPLFGILAESLSADEHRQLRDVAIGYGASVNDVLMTETFCFIDTWNRKYGKVRPTDRFRMLLPSNLRGRDDERMPATNMTSYNLITRSPKDCRDRIGLIRSVQQETARIKAGSPGTEFIETITRASRTRWGLPLGTMFRRSLGTVVLSNLGDPTRRYTARIPRHQGKLVTGGLTLEEIPGCPPLRDKTRLCLGITTYRRRLTVSLSCDPYVFNPAEERAMLRQFMDGLRSWIQ